MHASTIYSYMSSLLLSAIFLPSLRWVAGRTLDRLQTVFRSQGASNITLPSNLARSALVSQVNQWWLQPHSDCSAVGYSWSGNSGALYKSLWLLSDADRGLTCSFVCTSHACRAGGGSVWIAIICGGWPVIYREIRAGQSHDWLYRTVWCWISCVYATNVCPRKTLGMGDL